MKKLFGIAMIAGFVCIQAFSAVGGEAVDGKGMFNNVCAKCHKADGSGGPAPALKGQSAEDLTRKLKGYQDGTYGGEKKSVMQGVVKGRTLEEVKAVVDYIGTLK